jgi:hypothetical protein
LFVGERSLREITMLLMGAQVGVVDLGDVYDVTVFCTLGREFDGVGFAVRGGVSLCGRLYALDEGQPPGDFCVV